KGFLGIGMGEGQLNIFSVVSGKFKLLPEFINSMISFFITIIFQKIIFFHNVLCECVTLGNCNDMVNIVISGKKYCWVIASGVVGSAPIHDLWAFYNHNCLRSVLFLLQKTKN